ncbi:MAG: capsid cement protein [Candidatus Thorarchaeota archaeon]
MQISESMQQGTHPNQAPANGDHSAEGLKCTLTAGENLVFGEVCYFKSDGKCWKADSSATSTLPVFVIALESITADSTGEFLLYGFVRDDSWAWTVGGKIYISSTAGSLTQTVPAGEEVVTVGIATHADRMFFNPNYVNVSDVAYNATSWNANYDPATKNAIRDKFEALGGATIETGTYTGDGAGSGIGWGAYQEISLTFTPKYVLVYEIASGADRIFWCTDNQPSDKSWYFYTAGGDTYHFDDNYRLRIETNCFQVNDTGADADPNKNGRTYYYMAIG